MKKYEAQPAPKPIWEWESFAQGTEKTWNKSEWKSEKKMKTSVCIQQFEHILHIPQSEFSTIKQD